MDSTRHRTRFQDSYFRDYFRMRNSLVAPEIARRLVDLIGTESDGGYSEDLIRYSVARSAWHVSNDANAEAARLVTGTQAGERAPSGSWPTRERTTRGQISSSMKWWGIWSGLSPWSGTNRSRRLSATSGGPSSTGNGPFSSHPSSPQAGGRAWRQCERHGVWSKQVPEATRPGSGGRILLVPHSGYPTISPRQLRLRDFACELTDGRILLVDALDDIDRLLIIDSGKGTIEATRTLENVPRIRHIAACGPRQVLLATELDHSGRALILRIDLIDHTHMALELAESPDALLVLREGSQDPVVLVAVQRSAPNSLLEARSSGHAEDGGRTGR